MKIEYIPAGISVARMSDGRRVIDAAEETFGAALFPFPSLETKMIGILCRYKQSMQIFVDSGGFEILTGQIDDVNAEDMIEGMNRLATVGFQLDRPFLVRKDYSYCLDWTLKKAEQAKHLEKKFDYVLIVHGRGIDQMESWYNEMVKVDTFAGMSCRGRNLALLAQALLFLLSRKEKWKRWHILGTSSLSSLVLIRYATIIGEQAGAVFPDVLTFDSSSPLAVAKTMSVIKEDGTIMDAREDPSIVTRTADVVALNLRNTKILMNNIFAMTNEQIEQKLRTLSKDVLQVKKMLNAYCKTKDLGVIRMLSDNLYKRVLGMQ